jgi:hypothetical protein
MPFPYRNGGWSPVSDPLQRKRMAFVSHPHPTPPRIAGEHARPRPAPSAFPRRAAAIALPSLRARGRLVRGSAGAAAAVTAGSLRETSNAPPRDRIV